MLTLDARLLAWIVAHRVHALDGFMLTITSVGRGGVVWLAIGAAFLAARRMPLTAFLSLALAILTATLLVDHALKPLVGRARPFETRGHIEIIGARPGRASFPSGHSANAFAGAVVMARAVPAWSAAWWTLACLIAFSRLYLGVHYPLDVAAGALCGLACAAFSLWAIARIDRDGVNGSGRRGDS